MNVTEKIISEHLLSGALKKGDKISIRIDQTLTQDATGTMAWLQFEALGVPRVKTELSVSYVDHNMLQNGFENFDDHLFLQSAAARFGAVFSRPGNGICHQVHLERFGIPGKTLLGSDSHTPTAGGLGMLSMGAGGLDVALAMAGQPFFLTMPRVIGVQLTGCLSPLVSAKDIILELLRRLTVKGGVGAVIEYLGEGIGHLSVPQRATITNMGAELGATSSVFPSDSQTLRFMDFQNRKEQWSQLEPDEDAAYDQMIEIDLSRLKPMIARPHMPDKVVRVEEEQGKAVHQVCIGSCTNSSYQDLMTTAALLKGRRISPTVSLTISPGSKQVLSMIARNGALASLIDSGARILESSCGPCIGMGQAPGSESVTLRTFNRNFTGRSGTKDASIYLCSPETAVAATLTGKITDPRALWNEQPEIDFPRQADLSDSGFIFPSENGARVDIIRGPNIKRLPAKDEMPARIKGPVLIKVRDNITTDHIMPAGARILPLRSNIPAISEHVFEQLDPDFVKRARQEGGGFIVAGENYGQGSSREHAAIAPMYLGIKGVIAKSFARIHQANLVNFGIIPLTFVREEDYDLISQGSCLECRYHEETHEFSLVSEGKDIPVAHSLDFRELNILKAGGSLSFFRESGS
ncbi:MAG: aconitate hydratase [bacterium]